MDVNDLSYSFGFHLKELAEHEPERVSASSGISSARGALGECSDLRPQQLSAVIGVGENL